MPDQMSDEKIFVALEDIRKRAEVIRDSHCARFPIYTMARHMVVGGRKWQKQPLKFTPH